VAGAKAERPAGSPARRTPRPSRCSCPCPQPLAPCPCPTCPSPAPGPGPLPWAPGQPRQQSDGGRREEVRQASQLGEQHGEGLLADEEGTEEASPGGRPGQQKS